MYTQDKKALIAISGSLEAHIIPSMANRHGLISGATGTGKTITLQTMSETFSDMGVPVFIADIKGDLSGVAKSGGFNTNVIDRANSLGLFKNGFNFRGYPTTFWDVFGRKGHPINTPIDKIDVILMERLLDLNATQGAILSMIYKIAEGMDLRMIQLKDLRKMVEFVGEKRDIFSPNYGNIAQASVGAIQRALMRMDNEGAGYFFNEPILDLSDIIRCDANNNGYINVLAADELIESPKVYTTFLLWLLNKLYDELPEVGDLSKPKLILFFDEAHLLFNDMPKILFKKVEQVVRLIRSKGVGVYFSTQSPGDIPVSILGQLGNRIQHTLRAYTPADQKAVKVAAQTFRKNKEFDTEKAITQLKTGEALVSFLDKDGAPSVVERCLVLPPQSQVGPLSSQERDKRIKSSVLYGYYERNVVKETAFDVINNFNRKEARERESAKRIDTYEKTERKRETHVARLKREASRKFTTKLLNIFISAIFGMFVLHTKK